MFEFKTLNTIELIPILTRSIQELAEQNEALEVQLGGQQDVIESQKEDINQLTTRLQAIEGQMQEMKSMFEAIVVDRKLSR